jgi:hypothetical protein
MGTKRGGQADGNNYVQADRNNLDAEAAVLWLTRPE